ncbi:altered inheritance rate of mitochondria protein 29 [Zygosaccharomyces mellis]|uniref:Altered inheritance rate of mitochondria protein 29 n=1 Tax=Zygosaccharomyces mellis TaxID=42258 RepID=A0A4C2EH63_9SACH|nr:altered inheritance rate of mitochondria protein 29 [Zygosaccharomyces mellis]
MTTSFDFDTEEPLTSTGRPLTNATITVRVIKSFPYRNVKNLILQNYDLRSKTPKDLLLDCQQRISTEGAFRPFRSVQFDSLKVYTHAHGFKTINLVINFDHDEDWILDINDNEKKLYQYGIANETEISLFKWEDYVNFKANPEEKW